MSNKNQPQRAKRFDLWLNRRRRNRALRRGKKPVIVPSSSYGSTAGWVRLLGRTLLLHPKSRALFVHRPEHTQVSIERGWRSFTSVPASDETIKVIVEGEVVATTKTDDGGVLDAVIKLKLPPGRQTIQLETSNGDLANQTVWVVDESAEFGVISDIDDTILHTSLPSPLVAAWNSFVRSENARSATPGMPVLLDHLASQNPGCPVIYLSTGAWNVAPALTRFLQRHLYPPGPLLLTDWGPTADRWFRSGVEHKRHELRRLVREFPNVKWLLLGDDGQHDEKIYREFTEEFPDRVAAVAIRHLTLGEAVLAGGRSKAEKHKAVSGVPWVYGADGSSLREQLSSIGLF
ncbi:MAG: DUF2183 domain-containing protein [Microbacteriaceae bacterium]|nr:DUF2183 domain-containing protein [Microbacteriaceae bacterium]